MSAEESENDICKEDADADANAGDVNCRRVETMLVMRMRFGSEGVGYDRSYRGFPLNISTKGNSLRPLKPREYSSAPQPYSNVKLVCG